MQLIWEDQYRVSSYDSGLHKQAKLHALVNYFQESAQNHASHLGFGFDDLDETGQLWVLSRLKLQITRLPLWGDFIRLTTWPKNPVNPYAFRDFEILDVSGNRLLAGTSTWLVLDYETRKPIRDVESMRKKIPAPPEKHAISEPAPKLAPLKNGELLASVTSGFVDIDVNGHVNNTVYLAWLNNALPQTFLENYQIREVVLNYLSEVRMSEAIEIRGQESEGVWLLEGIKMPGKATAFRAQITGIRNII